MLRFKAIIEKSTNSPAASVVPGKNTIENDLTGIKSLHERV